MGIFFPHSDPSDNKHVLRPSFVAITNSAETKKLRIAYEQQRYEIDMILQQDDFLPEILLKLSGG